MKFGVVITLLVIFSSVGECVNVASNSTSYFPTPTLLAKKKNLHLMLSLRKSAWSEALLGDVDIGGSPVTLMVDTRASNVFVFDKESIQKARPLMFVPREDVKYYKMPEKQPKGEMLYFEYPDASGYWGHSTVGNVQIPKRKMSLFLPEKKREAVDKKFKFTIVDKTNDAAAITRGSTFGGVLGLNALAMDANGGSNFFQTLVAKKNIEPSFAFYISKDGAGATGTLIFGGVPKQMLYEWVKMAYFPVHESKDDPSWAVKFDKLMIGKKVILENFVAEFDTTSSSGLFDPSGELVKKYVEILKGIPELSSTTADGIVPAPMYAEGEEEVRVECDILEFVPSLRLVASDSEGKSHTFEMVASDTFSMHIDRKRRSSSVWCQSNFFQSQRYHDGGDGNKRKPEVQQSDKMPTIRLGLQFMKNFLTEYRMGRQDGGKISEAQIGIVGSHSVTV